MTVTPGAPPVIEPDAAVVATAPALELHTPPGVISDKVIVLPTQTLDGPVIGAGACA